MRRPATRVNLATPTGDHPRDTYVIDTRGLAKMYKSVNALKDLNLKVHKNSKFQRLGPKGAGKSTTIKLRLALTRPTAGTASVFDKDATQHSVAIRQRIGYLAQDPRYRERPGRRCASRRLLLHRPGDALGAHIDETIALVGLGGGVTRIVQTG
jgi:ABC-type multidrug transport system ATPase subunit